MHRVMIEEHQICFVLNICHHVHVCHFCHICRCITLFVQHIEPSITGVSHFGREIIITIIVIIMMMIIIII